VRELNERSLSAVFAALVGEPRCVASGNFATPRTLLRVFDGSVAKYRLHMLLAQRDIPDREGVTYETAFVGPAMRNHPRLDYVPCRLSLVPHLLARHRRPDVVLLHTTTPRDGRVSLGIETNILPAAIESAKRNGGIVVAQANPRMPYTFGDSEIDSEMIDYLFEADEPLASPALRENGANEQRIGALVAGEVPHGATLQMGIGAVPDSVLDALVRHRDLGVWTEVFSDGVLRLHASGALADDRAICTSFLFGSPALYSWVNRNRSVRLLRTETCNDPGTIAAQRRMTSINAALQVDLYDQANASRIGGRIYSGIGGSTDFLVGAMHSDGGQSFITLPSWHDKSDSSTIVPRLSDVATHSQHTAVITEHGIARVFGRSQSEQARNIIEQAAHPRAREGLLRAAREMQLL